MKLPARVRRWWDGLSRSAKAIVRTVMLLPLVEIAFWGLVELIGGRQGWGVIAGIGGVYSATYLLFCPKEVLEDPEIGGKLAKDYPLLARAICAMGILVCLTFAIAFAFARQLGLEALN